MTTVVMTGEGAKGAYQIGLVLYLRSKGMEVDKYVGISSGALGSFLFSQIEPSAIFAEAQKIKGISTFFSLKWNIFQAYGILKTSPIESLIRRLLKKSRLHPNKRTSGVVSYVDSELGTIHYKDINKLSDEDLIEAVLSAVSIPGLIHPYKFPFIDAGVVEINPVTWAVENGVKDIAVIMGRPLLGHHFKKPSGLSKIADMAYRGVDLMMHSMCVDDLLNGSLNSQGASISLYEPKSYLGSALDFKKSQIFLDLGVKGIYNQRDMVMTMKNLDLKF
jgi:predicted acylesterase/phospholipase RssA